MALASKSFSQYTAEIYTELTFLELLQKFEKIWLSNFPAFYVNQEPRGTPQPYLLTMAMLGFQSVSLRSKMNES